MVNFYRDVFPKRSHILAPLLDLAAKCGKRKGSTPKHPWSWKTKHQQAFEEAKGMILKEAELAFPDFAKLFHLYTNVSDVQLGATMVQDGRPLGFYTRKLNAAQLNYTVGEKELLGIVEGLKTFEGMVKGFDLTIHTNHLNLLYNKLPNQRMTRWRLLLEEFHPKVKHIVAADCLSRNEMKHVPFDVVEWEPLSKPLQYCDKVAKDPCMLLTQVMT